MYSKKIINRFKKPKFSGEIKNPDAVGKAGGFKCGDAMAIYLKIRNDKIQNIKFKTYGCVAAIASTDMICEIAKGKTLDEALKITSKDIIKKLGEMPQIKYHCSILGLNALKKAIENYKNKIKKDKN